MIYFDTVALALSFIAIVLNIKKIILCWPMWAVADVLWCMSSYYKGDWFAFSVWTVYGVFSLYGWYSWRRT